MNSRKTLLECSETIQDYRQHTFRETFDPRSPSLWLIVNPVEQMKEKGYVIGSAVGSLFLRDVQLDHVDEKVWELIS